MRIYFVLLQNQYLKNEEEERKKHTRHVAVHMLLRMMKVHKNKIT